MSQANLRKIFLEENLSGTLPPKSRLFKASDKDQHFFITMACWQAVEHGNVNDLLFAARHIKHELLPSLVAFAYEATGGMCVLFAAPEPAFNGLRIQLRYRFDKSVKANLFGGVADEYMNFWGIAQHDWKTY